MHALLTCWYYNGLILSIAISIENKVITKLVLRFKAYCSNGQKIIGVSLVK